MDGTSVKKTGGCACCGSCHTDATTDAAGARGWRLGAGAAGMFLLPLALAVVGAMVCTGYERWLQWLACLGGLATGLVASVVVGRLLGVCGGRA